MQRRDGGSDSRRTRHRNNGPAQSARPLKLGWEKPQPQISKPGSGLNSRQLLFSFSLLFLLFSLCKPCLILFACHEQFHPRYPNLYPRLVGDSWSEEHVLRVVFYKTVRPSSGCIESLARRQPSRQSHNLRLGLRAGLTEKKLYASGSPNGRQSEQVD